ncbi:unnamed protein product [Musa textilis]
MTIRSTVSILTLTIYNVNKRYISVHATWFVNKHDLGTLQLRTWQEPEQQRYPVLLKDGGFSEGLQHCTSLKYMSLRGVSRVKKLPDSIDKLAKLVVLDLRAWESLQNLPEAIRSAPKLQFLDVSEC